LFQNLPRITKSIRDSSFFKNEKFLAAIEHVKKNNSKLHFIGLVSPGLVHSFDEHLYALLELAKKEGLDNAYVHGFLDGRDTVYNSGKGFIKDLLYKMDNIKFGKLASLAGRKLALDRDNHWERVEQVFKAMVRPEEVNQCQDVIQAIDDSYANEVFDEEFGVIALTDDDNKPIAKIEDNDAVIFFDFRADRARELTKAFVLPEFEHFDRGVPYFSNLYFVTMTEYEKGLPVEVAFPAIKVESCLAKEISLQGMKQLHIAETEKYAHVTFFFNAGKEKPYSGEDRIVVSSPRVASYAEKPEMSIKEVNQKLLNAISEDKYDFVVCNYANPDMVAHTGNLEASIKAIAHTDKALGNIVDAVLAKNGVLLVTADHGNAEELINLKTGEMDKEHSVNPVPLIVVGQNYQGRSSSVLESIGNDLSLLTPVGVLSDVTATVLYLLQIEASEKINGRSLV
jgi:2,3-bisphosphoglycerate-independent phosphoglycerate mutase